MEKTYADRVRARNQKYEGFGQKLSCPEWARRLGLPRATVWRYLKGGLTVEEIAQTRGVKYIEK